MMMVMEYCEHGSLQAFLRESEPLPLAIRCQVALDAARGLEYLAARGKNMCFVLPFWQGAAVLVT